jgi:hypothetical protein
VKAAEAQYRRYFPAGRPPILARSRAKELATAELYLPLGPAN